MHAWRREREHSALLDHVGDRPVEVLVNNAGFGSYGPFAEADPDRENEEIAVDVGTVVALARAFLPGMLARGSGGILNVASTIAFQPAPYQAVYGANKAFVLSLSQALWAEARAAGLARGSRGGNDVMKVLKGLRAEAVTAVVVIRPGDALNESELISVLKADIASFKVPKRVHLVADLPRNAMGKVQKNVLRDGCASGRLATI